MTPEQWKAVEESLAYPHGRAELLCDGRKVVAVVEPAKKLRYHVVVYVDGFWRGEWLRFDRPCDEQRFMNPHAQAAYSTAELARARKVFGRKQYSELAERKVRWFSPDFPTAKAFRRRITATCKSIGLVTCSQAEIAALEAKSRSLSALVLMGQSRQALQEMESP
jgi:hypothetical protein